MTDSIYIKGAALAGEQMQKADLLLENGRITAIIPEPFSQNGSGCKASAVQPGAAIPKGARIIDARGLLLSYGFADIHVHLREPGNPEKETIATGSRAAARGGYTTVCAMPNLNPVPDTAEHLQQEMDIIRRDAVVEVLPYCSITKGRKGLELTDMAALKDFCCAFSDDGSGVQNRETMLRAMRLAAELDCIIAAHCEDNSLLHGGYIHDGSWCAAHGHNGISSESEWRQIERDLEIAAASGCRYHVCHISTARSAELIRQAKASGVRVSCETAPHYLLLCEDDMQEDGRFKMNPPLRTAADREALVEALRDGTIDAVATDHAPHTIEQKSLGLKGSAMGVVGLETAFPALYSGLVLPGTISLQRLMEALTDGPRRAFRLGGALRTGERADLVLLDPAALWTAHGRDFVSKGHSTPFEGMQLRGKTRMTIYKGVTVYDSEKEEASA